MSKLETDLGTVQPNTLFPTPLYRQGRRRQGEKSRVSKACVPKVVTELLAHLSPALQPVLLPRHSALYRRNKRLLS